MTSSAGNGKEFCRFSLGKDISISIENGSKLLEYLFVLLQCDFSFIQGCWNNNGKCGPTGAHGAQPKMAKKQARELRAPVIALWEIHRDFISIFFLGLNLCAGLANFAMYCFTFSHLNLWFRQTLNSKFYSRGETLSWNSAKSEFFLQLKPKYVKHYILFTILLTT